MGENWMYAAALGAAVLSCVILGLSWWNRKNNQTMKVLRIGYVESCAENSLWDALETFVDRHTKLQARLFQAGEEELLQGLSRHKLDVISLPMQANLSDKFPMRQVSFLRSPNGIKYDGVMIEPIGQRHFSQQILWRENENNPVILEFVEGLPEDGQK